MSRSGPEKSKARVISPPSPFFFTVASSAPSRQARSARSPKRTRSPGFSRLPGFMKAVQREGDSRRCSVASTRTTDSSRIRTPESRAAITLVSLTTTTSPGLSSSGRSRTIRSSSAPSTGTRSSRAASRGSAGRNAIRSSGSSKSKSETFIEGELARP